ncbi:hypothetical protein [Ilumatobacter sp.]|uniref:hypothetical protein n=1 Tax=Ilumatobacter sp. TaxID=1967498 RepID=UPI003C51BC34
MSDPANTPRTVARFADGLLHSDLPRLGEERRREAVDFIGRRVLVLPSITRFGVLVIAAAVDVAGTVVGHERMRGVVTKLPVPLVSEYPRLVRSLGYAYVWETWPDTRVDGAATPDAAPDAPPRATSDATPDIRTAPEPSVATDSGRSGTR